MAISGGPHHPLGSISGNLLGIFSCHNDWRQTLAFRGKDASAAKHLAGCGAVSWEIPATTRRISECPCTIVLSHLSLETHFLFLSNHKGFLE